MTTSNRCMAIVGTGVMGRGIAQLAALAGERVLLHDANAGAASAAQTSVAAELAKLEAKGKLAAGQAAAAAARLEIAPDLAGLADCWMVVEAIVEKLEAKQALFLSLEAIVGPECILASNTSTLEIGAIAAACRAPARVAGFHFFNPVPLMKVVEVVDGALTAPWVTEALAEFARRMGHRPVRAKDSPGFIVNHAGRGYGPEALRIVGEGISSYGDIDGILREAAGFRMGPFELYDLIGLDISHAVMDSMYLQYYQEPRYRPSPLTGARVRAGLIGRKTGNGFYRYEGGKPVALPPAPALPAADLRRPVWVSARGLGAHLRPLIEKLGAALETSEKPSAEALCLVAPLGSDATTAALAEGLDAARTLAVDALFPLERRRTLMTTPVTRPEMRDAAQALLAADGVPVTLIHDSPGFVTQRVLAHIVNVAADIAQQRIASPEDIDAAVKLGLGYPLGPLAWGDALGSDRILAILEGLLTFYGDPRYRPSPWLKRRALLGVSLLTPEG